MGKVTKRINQTLMKRNDDLLLIIYKLVHLLPRTKREEKIIKETVKEM